MTTFFRDTDAFDALQKLVIPHLFEGKDSAPFAFGHPAALRAKKPILSPWSYWKKQHTGSCVLEIQVFATDVDPGALATAREGRYPAAIEADVSEERLRRFLFQRKIATASSASCAIPFCLRRTTSRTTRLSHTST